MPILLLRKRKLRHSLGRPSRSDFVQPEVVETKDYAEGVYLASGGSTDNSSGPEETACRFGRKEANAGSDTCQECSKSGGQRNTPLPGEESAREADFTGCIDGRPVKRS